MVDGQAGKGDKRRPMDYKKWSDNYDAIFGKKTEDEADVTDSPESGETPSNQLED